MFDVARTIEEAGLGSSQEFFTSEIRHCLDADLDPQARSLEGYLSPTRINSRARRACPRLPRSW